MTSRAFLLVLATAAACARPAYPPPPATRETPVVDTLHGVAISDPYRWLEDQQSEEVHRWIVADATPTDTGDTHSRRGRGSSARADGRANGVRASAGDEYFTCAARERAAAIFVARPRRRSGYRSIPTYKVLARSHCDPTDDEHWHRGVSTMGTSCSTGARRGLMNLSSRARLATRCDFQTVYRGRSSGSRASILRVADYT